MSPESRDRLVALVSSVAGAGYSPVVSGTVGTAAAIPLFLFLRGLPCAAYSLIVIGAIAAGTYLGDQAQRIWGNEDPKQFVFDEAVGLLITCLGFSGERWWLVAICGFFAFRFFDVAKLPPARFFDRKMPTGAGIMLDDVVAGIYANLVLQVLFRIF
jgi:phosphatidylglycerophosphatase A